MMKKIFGPFPDEPLLYSFDKILGLFHKFDFKSKCKDAEVQIDSAVPVDEKIVDVIDAPTTANNVTITKKISMEIVETSSQTSKKSTMKCTKNFNSNKVDELRGIPQRSEHNPTSRSVLKISSSMECNYALSKINVAKKSVHTGLRACTKKANSCTKSSTKRYAKTKGFGDSVTVVENTFERKMFKSDGKNRFESILKRETKQKKVISSQNIHINGAGQLGNKTLNELVASQHHKTSKNVKLKDRKVIKTEWAVTRICTYDDDSQTYEIMKKDKVLEKNGGIERIFAIAPNLTTVAYNPLKQKGSK